MVALAAPLSAFPGSSINGGWELASRSWSPWEADHLALAFYYGPTPWPVRIGGGGGWAFDRGPLGLAGVEVPLWEVWNPENHSRTWALVTRGSLYAVGGEPLQWAGSAGLTLPWGDGFVPTIFIQARQHKGWEVLVSLNGAVGFEESF